MTFRVVRIMYDHWRGNRTCCPEESVCVRIVHLCSVGSSRFGGVCGFGGECWCGCEELGKFRLGIFLILIKLVDENLVWLIF